MMRTAIAVKDLDVSRELTNLGVTSEELIDAARYGEWARRSCHRFDPPSFAGTSRWAVTMRRLRLVYTPRNWSAINDHGVPFILSPDRSVAITTARGNHDTGNPDRHPRTMFKKGAVALTAARQNRAAQIELLPTGFEERHVATLTQIPEDAMIYYLLVNRRGANLHAELSSPIGIDQGGFATAWKPRIILGAFPVDDPATLVRDDDDVQDIDINITPRNAS